MKNKTLNTFVMLVVFALVCCVPMLGIAAEQQAAGSPEGKMSPFHKCFNPVEMKAFFMQLNLTDAQKTALQALKTSTETATQPLRDQISAQRAAIAATLLADTIDTAKADAQVQALLPLVTQMTQQIAQAKQQEAQILTPEQRKLVLDKITALSACKAENQGSFGPFGHHMLFNYLFDMR